MTTRKCDIVRSSLQIETFTSIDDSSLIASCIDFRVVS